MFWKHLLEGLARLWRRDRGDEQVRSGQRTTTRGRRAWLDLEHLERRDVFAVVYKTGDFNGDRIPDLVGIDVPNSRLLLTYWYGVTATVTGAAAVPVPTLPFWREVLLADVNGDGRVDLVGRHSVSGVPMVALSIEGWFASQTTWGGAFDPAVTWANVVAGDFNGDGRQDLAARNTSTGRWSVAVSTGQAFLTSDWGGVWVGGASSFLDVRAGDFDGDGRSDLAGRTVSGNWQVALSSGTVFTTQDWGAWDPAVAWADVLVGDFTGDGRADLVGRRPSDNQLQVGSSTGVAFATSTWGMGQAGRVSVQVSDLNLDGKADLIGQQSTGGTWSAVSQSTGSAFAAQSWLRTNSTSFFSTFSWTGGSVPDLQGPARVTLAAFHQVRNTVGMEFYRGFKCQESFESDPLAII